MNILLSIFKIYLPGFIKKSNLRDLFRITGNAFRCPAPSLKGLTYEEILKKYAIFAQKQCEEAVRQSGNIAEIKKNLYENSREAGNRLRKSLQIKKISEVMDASKLFYSMLGIRFQGFEDGKITIEKCFFAEYFSPETCRIISSLDEGMAAGLTGGRQLDFIQRITEGKDCCKAVLR